jgi:flagellar hook-associated protein 3 FlgL
MSGSSITGLAPSSYGLMGQLIADSNAIQNRMATLTQQSASGKVSGNYAGLGSGAQVSMDLRAEMAQQQTWINGISTADTSIGVTQTAMNQISSIASSFYAQLKGLPVANVDALAASARSALQQVAGLLDVQNGSEYAFAGQDSGNAPVPDPQNILQSGFFTQIQTAVAGLATNGATATAAATLAIASSNAAGTSPFSASLSQPASALQAQRTSVQVGPGQSVQIGLLASANSLATSTGSSTTGSYVRDLLRGLATIGSLTSAQANEPGFQGLIDDTSTSLQGAISAMSDEEGALGAVQNQIDTTSTVLSGTQTALTTQVSNIENVDAATTISNLNLVQTQLQASFKLIAGMSNLSLVNYL